MTHLLKNGVPAHVLTTEDRRKAAARTNEIRRMKRELAEDEELTREINRMLARKDARRTRSRERERRRRFEKGLGEQAPDAYVRWS
jgi:hypothetical protein